MYDPQTVAFDIKYPWAKSFSVLKDGSRHKHRQTFEPSGMHIDEFL